MIQLLYPSAPFSKKEPDEDYFAEFNATKEAGIASSVYAEEDWQQRNQLLITPAITPDAQIIYRGWMFREKEYQKFADTLKAQGLELLASTKQYLNCHYLPKWYPLCQEHTPQTIFPNNKEDISKQLAQCHWKGYFVKDYVKSLTTQRGSVAHSIAEIHEIIDLLIKYRGEIEGGLCIRELENFQTQTEERYFVFKKQAFGRTGDPAPQLVTELAKKIDSPFFSADIVLNQKNEPRLIELGDGQVSDIKKWTPEQFMRIFQTSSN